MVLRVLDIESTGTDPATCDIIEIASLDLVKGGSMVNARSDLVATSKPIPPEASAVHHILAEDLVGARDINEVLIEYADADWFVAHNADFERSFLGPHWPHAKWLCTYKCALRVWPSEPPGHSNQVLRYWLGIISPFGIDRKAIDPHRALSDCYVTGEIAHRLLAAAPFADLVKWSSEPPLHTKLGFGKHRGQRFDEAPADYLEWIRDKSEMDEGAKFSAAYWLERRAA